MRFVNLSNELFFSGGISKMPLRRTELAHISAMFDKAIHRKNSLIKH